VKKVKTAFGGARKGTLRLLHLVPIKASMHSLTSSLRKNAEKAQKTTLPVVTIQLLSFHNTVHFSNLGKIFVENGHQSAR
jgi:hypothetical protein